MLQQANAQTVVFQETFVPDASGYVYYNADQVFDGSYNTSDGIGGTLTGNPNSGGWIYNGAYINVPANLTVVSPNGVTGPNSYYLLNTTSGTPPGAASPRFYGTFYNKTIPVQPNKTYKFSFYFAVGQANRKPAVDLFVSDNGGLNLNNSTLLTAAQRANYTTTSDQGQSVTYSSKLNVFSQTIGQWYLFETQTFTTSSTATQLTVSFYNNQWGGGGNDWGFDELKLIDMTPTITLSGQVWDDADGNVILNGSETGTNAGGPLYVNLVDGTNTVIGSTTVSASGSYTLTGVPASTTGLKLVLSTSPTAATPGPLPSQWVNTGESVNPSNPATQGATLGQIELTTGTTPVTAQNFGIEKLPTPGSGVATVTNPGGTSPVTAPPAAFTNTTPSTDTAPGSVTAIRITTFPSNVTSLTINGTPYIPGSFPGGGVVVPTNGNGAPTVPILVDPANDTQPVTFTLVAIDNAGKESTTTGTAVLNSALTVPLTGQVWDDADGNLTLNGSEAGTNAGGPLYVNLVDGTNTVIASTSVSPTGSYTFAGVPANTTGLKLVLSTSPTAATPGPLPSQWVNTGESVNPSNPATQGATLGQIELTTGTTPVTAQNFGIEKLPTPGSGSNTVSNAGGTTPVTVPANTFTNTTPSTDTAPGSVTAIKITTFPSNVTSLTINGTPYTPGTFPGGGVVVPTDGNGNPTVPILVDPANDTQPSTFTLVAIDNAGKESTTTGTATINSTPTITLSGQVWDDADGSVTINSPETGTNAGGPLYVNLVNSSGTVIGSAAVGNDGSYTLPGVPTNTTGLKLVLSNSPTATTPGPLPSQWVNTGENVGSSNQTIQSATLGQIELTTGTTNITAQNFGIEKLPTPGSGTATVSNPGGNSPVTAPPAAFTNVAPSTDTAPGSVTAIRIPTFPTNTTSLTINGTTYTSGTFPANGVVVPTNGNGAPTVPILVDPTDDTQPVVIPIKAIDNAGKESTTTGTATLNSVGVPDLTPIIYARPSTVYNTTDMTVVVDVLELLGVSTNGLITVRVTKDPKLILTFPPTATTIGGRSVSNSVWTFDNSTTGYYTLTTTQPVTAFDKLSFGFTGTLTPGATSGVVTVSSVIIGGSGGEVKTNNNVDADRVEYFQQ
ncbi:beta strand repeat-containing protein [Spirosoma validum]|uniref:Uncharacterized protein n=1 Tax=Spirosoma validum TaxID=2771355 RepID=A0A927B059_9BACT|nr:hypothetical protein [Spirosoma validum]MBD2752969.1 hypothetical protein [Spirosoma validum]